MTERACEVAVIGAGPAGLAAACRAAESGACVILIDDNPRPGGQIWRASSTKLHSAAARWTEIAAVRKVETITGARVVAAPEPGRLSIERFHDAFELRYRNLILATGARERFLPFPGWTLPNVAGAGGLQALVKSGLPVEGKRIVVAGSGPLLLAVAKYLRDRGAHVSLIAEQAKTFELFRFGVGLASRPAKLVEAARLGLGVRYLTECWPVAAQPGRATLRRNGRTWSEPCDFLACGFGLIPNTELAALLGCSMDETGVAVDELQQTSIAGTFCAGEVSGIGGLDLSLCEGEIAGYAAIGRHDDARRLFAARASHRRFAGALERAFLLRPDLRSLPDDETTICRCEDVAFGQVRHCSGWREAKLLTRCGMGPCQGRVCGPAVEFLLGWKPDSVRPPVFPARVSSL